MQIDINDLINAVRDASPKNKAKLREALGVAQSEMCCCQDAAISAQIVTIGGCLMQANCDEPSIVITQ